MDWTFSKKEKLKPDTFTAKLDCFNSIKILRLFIVPAGSAAFYFHGQDFTGHSGDVIHLGVAGFGFPVPVEQIGFFFVILIGDQFETGKMLGYSPIINQRNIRIQQKWKEVQLQ